MKALSCTLLALAAATALCGQPARSYVIKHTMITGEVVNSGCAQDIELNSTVAKLKDKLAAQYQVPKGGIHVIWRDNERPDDFDLEEIHATANYDLHLVFDFFLIKVFKSDGSYVTLGSHKEDTFGQLKGKIARRLNIPCEMQSLLGLSREFQDGEKLGGNMIVDRTSYVLSLVLKPGKVRVKLPSGEILTFEYEHFEMVASLKDKIQQAKGIAQERQNILLKGKGELGDDMLLASFGLSSSSTLTLVEREPDELDIIHVRLVPQRLLTFAVDLAKDTVASLKAKINQAEGIAQGRQHLFVFKGKEMVDSRLLFDYITRSESVVDLLLCSDSSNQDAVAEHHLHLGPVGEEIDLKTHFAFNGNDTVASVKSRLRSEKNVPQDQTLHLYFENKELEDDKPMLEHVNENGSMLHVMTRGQDGPEMIHVRLPTGRLITFEFLNSGKVKELGDLVRHHMEAYKTSHIRLFFGNQELGDEGTLSHYNIASGSTVNLIAVNPGDV